MGHLLTCVINRAELIEDAVHGEQALLSAPPLDACDGYGVGFYQAGEVLHRKRPQANEAAGDWTDVVRGIKSHVAIAQVRTRTGGDGRADNTHPFRMRQWLFAHAGSLAAFEAVKPALVESLPDFVRRNIRGDTDSEHLFHLLLSFIHDAGQLDGSEVADQHVVGAIRSTVSLVDRLGNEVGAPAAALNFALTNGRQVYVVRRGAPMVIVQRERLPLGAEDQPNPSRDTVRYVLTASHDSEQAPTEYRTLEEGSITSIDRDLQINSYSI